MMIENIPGYSHAYGSLWDVSTFITWSLRANIVFLVNKYNRY